MRDLNFLCTGRSNVEDRDLIAIESVHPDFTTVVQELQFLRERDAELVGEIGTLKSTLDNIDELISEIATLKAELHSIETFARAGI
jgi:prefoldin subunit 5|tara:strand:- start:975 stop:1232 length:258 start_codon:yes stop_codon:yes gene_type:complete